MILAGLDKYSSIMTSVATGATAIIAYMSYRHLKNRDTIKATIRQTVNENGNPTIQIANVGAIAFAVLEVGIDDMPFRYGRETFLPNHLTSRNIGVGESAFFDFPTSLKKTHGRVFARLANGTIIKESI